MSIITLLTDFGLQDNFIGVMKGVILSINSKAKIVDITHSISSQNVKEAGWQLYFAYNYFPRVTIHLVVVDPGVGSKRKIILVETKNYFFLAPDNGVLSYILYKEKPEKIVEITNKKYFLKNVSSSFHGRDIFASVAGHLSLNKNINNFGKILNTADLKLFTFPLLKKINENTFIGEIIYIDKFGNLLTNIPNDFLSNKNNFIIQIKNKNINFISDNYSQVKNNNLLAIKGSNGFMEIAVNLKSAKKLLKIKVGDKVTIKMQ